MSENNQRLVGLKGDPGPKGEKGPCGIRGPRGEIGPRGLKGEHGSVCVNCKPTETRLVYPSILFFPSPQDLLIPDFQTFDTYPLSGWHFNDGTLTFPVKKCNFYDIKRIDIGFYAFDESTLSINVNTQTTSVNYTCKPLVPGSYQGSTINSQNLIYDEKFAFFNTTKSCSKLSSKVDNITITNPGKKFVISNLRITYTNYIMNFQLLNFL